MSSCPHKFRRASRFRTAGREVDPVFGLVGTGHCRDDSATRFRAFRSGVGPKNLHPIITIGVPTVRSSGFVPSRRLHGRTHGAWCFALPIRSNAVPIRSRHRSDSYAEVYDFDCIPRGRSVFRREHLVQHVDVPVVHWLASGVRLPPVMSKDSPPTGGRGRTVPRVEPLLPEAFVRPGQGNNCEEADGQHSARKPFHQTRSR